MNPATLVYVNSNEEKEINRLLQTIEEKREQVEELTVTMENLKTEVNLFQHRYNARVGRYYFELDKVDLESKEYRLRIQLRREDISEDKIEARVEACFRENRARIDAATEQPESEEDAQTNHLPDEEAKYLQILYRKLAKRFHPDKSEETDEKNRHSQLMLLINRAYKENDIQNLERLSFGETEATLKTEEPINRKMERLHTELRCLNRATSELRTEINRVKAGRTYQLKQQVETAEKKGIDLLKTLASDIKRKVQSSSSQLSRLKELWSAHKKA